MYHKTAKHLLSLVLVLALCAGVLTCSVSAAGSGPAVSSNIDDHYYINVQRWTDPIKSTLAPEGDGFVRVEYIDGALVVENYDADLQYVSGQTLELELPVYGGVYLCDDYNFVVVGQNNTEEDDTKEVFRIIRYSKDWVREDSAGLFGANTTYPFDAGCVRFDRSGDILYIRTSHEMYTSSDGYNHQANVMIALRISDMTITDSFTDILNKNYGYVSHSFNQFVRVDGTDLLAVDHGDALPRSVVLFKYNAPAGQETFYGRVSYVNALPIVDSTYHYNDTGVSVGGFEFSSTDYLIAGCSYDQIESADLMNVHRNIFVTATPKDDFTDEGTTVHWLTDYTADDGVTVSPPHLVKLEQDRFFLVWTEDDVLKYCFLNGKGQLESEIITGEGDLSDCVPVVDGSRVVWYVTNNSAPVFYEIPTAPHTHSYTCTTAEPTCTADGSAVYTCECGDSYTETLPATGHSFADGQCSGCGIPGGTAGDLNWILEDGTLTISGSGDMPDFAEDAAPWFSHADAITGVVVEPGVTSTGNFSFYKCANLTDVSLPEGLTRIGQYTFARCASLEQVDLPATVNNITARAFLRCTSLRSIALPEGITDIGYESFWGCESLESVSFPETLTGIGVRAFEKCTGLTSITLPDSVTVIGISAFQLCTNLEEVYLGSGTNSFGDGAFDCCTSLRAIHISQDSTRYVSVDGVLYTRDMTSLVFFPPANSTQLTIPASVDVIRDDAFCNGSDMLSVIRFEGGRPSMDQLCFYGITATCYYPIGESSWVPNALGDYWGDITWIPYGTGETIASGWSGYTTWTLSADGLLTISGEGAMKNYTSKSEMPWYADSDLIKAVVIESGVTAIGDYAFYGMPNMQTISIPASVTYIGHYAFKNSTALVSAPLPAGLTTLGDSAFFGCASLASIEIPAGLWTVREYTFKNCTGLKSVTFHEGNLQKISDGAFYNTGLTKVVLPDCLDILDIYTFKNCVDLASVTLGTGLTEIREAAFYATALTELDVPEGITKVGPYAFKNCTELATVNLPESLTSIGEAAFYGSTIAALDIPDGVTTIGSYAFKNCTALAELTLPDNLTAISEACFYNCSALETFVLPDNVVTIDDYAFRNCTALMVLERDGGDPKLQSVGTSSFQGCTNLVSFATNQGFTTIGDYAFKNCASLVMFTMYGTETTLGDSAFHSCTALESIIICEGTETIGDYCFAGCTELRDIHFLCDAPAIGPSAFARVTATAHYSPITNDGWTADVLQNYGGTLTWVDEEA